MSNIQEVFMNWENRLQHKYDQPIEIADGIFWVGYYDESDGLHCNPYLIVEGDEAILVDGGNRPDFSTVMIKVLQTGIKPSQIKRLIYQHYDPDLCGSIPQLDDIINSSDLRIISHRENNIFIKYYSERPQRLCIESQDFTYKFKTGRTLKFIKTPYSHSAGSFVTYDTKTKTLLSSDIFGGYGNDWSLFLTIDNVCRSCDDFSACPKEKVNCSLSTMLDFHCRIMTSNKALQYALRVIGELDIEMIAPQHGSVIYQKEDISFVIEKLLALNTVGINRIEGGTSGA